MERSIEQRLDEAGAASISELPTVAAAAQDLARTVATSDGVKTERRRHKIKMVSGLCAALVLGGATAATAGPAIVEWAPWEPDVMVERSFPLSDTGSTASCAVIVRVTRDERTAGPDADARLRDAREFLQEQDWSSLDASIADIPPRDLKAMTAQGISEPLMLTMRIGDQVDAKFEAAGHLGRGVVVESVGRCDDEAAQ